MNPHLIEGDFDEQTFYLEQIKPLIEAACLLANSRDMPYVGLFQVGSDGHDVHHMMFAANQGITGGVRAHLSDVVVAMQLLLEAPEAPECREFRMFACAQKRHALKAVREEEVNADVRTLQ